jgi:hypothetical protein
MNYTDARPLIKTGDLIAVRRRSGFLAVATRIVTRSPYTHTGIAVWCAGRLLLAQENAGGCNVVPLSQEAIYDFDVYDCPTEETATETLVWLLLGARIAYSILDLFRITGFLLLRIPLPKHDGDELVCSALSALIFQKAGWVPVGLPSIPWPGAVAAAVGKPARIEVRVSG